jgi:hypothetical protein
MSSISWRANVKPHPAQDKGAYLAPVTTLSTTSRARRARQARAGRRYAVAPRASCADLRRRNFRHSCLGSWGVVARRAPAAFLRPVGHVGAGAHSAPAADRTELSAATSAAAEVLQRAPSLRRPIVKPRKIAVKGARYARVASRRPLTASLGEDSAAPIGGMAGSERSSRPKHTGTCESWLSNPGAGARVIATGEDHSL